MGEVEKNNFIALPGKGGHSGPMPLKTVCPNLGVFDEKIFGFFFFFFFLAALGLCCRTRAFSSCGEQGLLFVAVHGLLIAVASLVVEHGL